MEVKPFVPPELLPTGIAIDWEMYMTRGWRRMASIAVHIGKAPTYTSEGIVKVSHEQATGVNFAEETCLLLRATGMTHKAIGAATYRGEQTVKTNVKGACRHLECPVSYIAIQRFFDIGVLSVQQKLVPAREPGEECSRFLQLLAIHPTYTEIGKHWEKEGEGERLTLTNDQIRYKVGGFKARKELPRALTNPYAYVLWGNLTGIIPPRESAPMTAALMQD